MRQAPLLLPWSEAALAEAPAPDGRQARALVLPVAVEPSDPTAEQGASDPGIASQSRGRDIAAVTYAANPSKKGLDRVLSAWRRVHRPGEELVVAGAMPDDLALLGVPADTDGVRATGLLAPLEYRALVRRARVFVSAARREDYGIAQLEALADGCLLVTTPAPGPYVALPIARALDPRLVGEDLGAALRVALDEPRAEYATRAREAITPFRRAAVDRLVAEQLLPRLLA